MASEEQEQVEVEVMEGMNEEEDAGGSNMVIIIVAVVVCLLCVTGLGILLCYFMKVLCFAVDELKCEVEGDHCKEKYLDKTGGAEQKGPIKCEEKIKDETDKDKAKEKCIAPIGMGDKTDPCCKFSTGGGDDKPKN